MHEYSIGPDVHDELRSYGLCFMAVLDDRKVRSTEQSESDLIAALERKEDQNRPAGYGTYLADVEAWGNVGNKVAAGIPVPSREEEAVRDFIRKSGLIPRGERASEQNLKRKRIQTVQLLQIVKRPYNPKTKNSPGNTSG
ncbi:MAG: hypothetical protein LBK62_11485, partial [Treponema sp.]|nr:hypothetical protein [Treponema sp.]